MGIGKAPKDSNEREINAFIMKAGGKKQNWVISEAEMDVIREMWVETPSSPNILPK